MFEMFTWELHATFLRNHNARPQRTPSRRQLPGDAQDPETHKPRRKLKLRRRPHPRQPPASPATAHIPSRHNCQKHGGTAPDMGRYTRYGALHPNRRGALPTDRVQCPTTQEQTRNWQPEPLPATTSPGAERPAGCAPLRLPHREPHRQLRTASPRTQRADHVAQNTPLSPLFTEVDCTLDTTPDQASDPHEKEREVTHTRAVVSRMTQLRPRPE